MAFAKNVSVLNLSTAFQTVELLAKGSRWQRFRHRPLRYAEAMWFKEWVYPKTKKGKSRQALTFFGKPMQVILPAGMDIYLTGGKTHDSELRLTRWLLKHLSSGQTFVDIGAHFGYFSLLAAELVGEKGQVFALEAAQGTFDILQNNTSDCAPIQAFHKAVSDTPGTLTFYEFPVLFSEYNTLNASQFEHEAWYKNNPPQSIEVEAITLDHFFQQQTAQPTCIKIDAEGAELQILQGAEQLLRRTNPTLIMEYQLQDAPPAIYEQAVSWLNNLGYKTLVITTEGDTEVCANISSHLRRQNLQSDNIIAQKP